MEAHLPCPPLREWLPRRFDALHVGVAPTRRAPQRIRRVLRAWPLLDEPQPAVLASLDALIFAVRLDRPEPPEPFLEFLRPGTVVVELAWPRARPLRRWLDVEGGERRRAELGQSRVLQWLARGYFELEQWESVEPDEVLVTLCRAR